MNPPESSEYSTIKYISYGTEFLHSLRQQGQSILYKLWVYIFEIIRESKWSLIIILCM